MLQIEKKYLDEMIAHATEEKPNEACGLLAGDRGRAVKLYRGVNVDEKRLVRYSMDPLAQLHALREIDDNDWELLAIYHSHPHTQAYPSATDVQLAFYPDSMYVIISLMDPDQPVARAFRIVDSVITEEEIQLL